VKMDPVLTCTPHIVDSDGIRVNLSMWKGEPPYVLVACWCQKHGHHYIVKLNEDMSEQQMRARLIIGFAPISSDDAARIAAACKAEFMQARQCHRR
jgi:hypothetical protein